MFWSGKLDEHSPTHFFGCYALVLTFFIWGSPIWLAALLGILAGVIWEVVGDEILCKGRGCCGILFDKRGGDWFDMLVGGAGVLLALLVLAL